MSQPDRGGFVCWLAHYRELRHLSQTELGRLAGVSRETISNIERGIYAPGLVLALRLAKTLGQGVETIFELEEQSAQQSTPKTKGQNSAE